MSKVVDLERVRMQRLADELMPFIAEAFAGQGIYKVGVADVENVDRWRRAAKACARKLGVTARTSLSTDGASVWIVDTSPATLPERVRAARSIDYLLR